MKSIRICSPLAFTLSLLPLAGCAATEGDGSHERRSWKNPAFSAEAFFSEVELDEIEFDDDLQDILGDRITEVERQRAGVRVAVGVDNVRAYAQVFGEEWDEFDASDLKSGSAVSFDDLFGIGLGVVGEPPIRRVSEDVRVVLPYRAGINLVFGEGNFTDTMGTLLKSPTEEGDFAYIEEEVSVGIGVHAHGFQPSFGVYASFLSGLVEDDIVADDDNDDLRLEGSNTGLYLELSYQDVEIPLRVGVRGTVGNVHGLEAFFGVAL